MEIKKYTIILSLLTLFLFGDDDYFIDEYRDKLSSILVNTISSIDNFFVDSNESLHNDTHAEFSTSIAQESRLKLEKDISFKIRLRVPKIKKHLKLFLEDENSDDILYDETRLQKDTIQDKRYYARLEFLKFDIKGFTTKFSGGVRIRSRSLVPYANHHINYKIHEDKRLKSNISNNFRLYTDGELEDYLDLTTLYSFNDSLTGIWRNAFRYNKTPIETFYSDYSFLCELPLAKELEAS